MLLLVVLQFLIGIKFACSLLDHNIKFIELISLQTGMWMHVAYVHAKYILIFYECGEAMSP